jgi:Rieske 2Fe-2S family protein
MSVSSPPRSPVAWAADVRKPLAEARNLPGFVFWDDAVHRSELDELFGRMWVCVGREEDLPRDGSFLTFELGAESVLVVHAAPGDYRAFFNTCRHRGTRLVERERGEGLLAVVCPYHAWCYGLDGKLKAAPKMERVEGFRFEDHGLLPVRLERWQGFLFLCLDGETPSLRDSLSDFPTIDAWGLDCLRRGDRRTYEVVANWKVICENYSECYHCPSVHPQLHRITFLGSSRDPVAGVSYNGGPMDLREGCATMSFDGTARRPALPGLDSGQRRVVHYYVLYPNLLLSLHPDYVMSHRLTPLGAERTRVVCEWYFHPDVAGAEDFDPSDAVEFWDLVNRQDWGLCEGVQRGSRSRGYRPGPYQDSETCVHFFDRWWVEKMGF